MNKSPITIEKLIPPEQIPLFGEGSMCFMTIAADFRRPEHFTSIDAAGILGFYEETRFLSPPNPENPGPNPDPEINEPSRDPDMPEPQTPDQQPEDPGSPVDPPMGDPVSQPSTDEPGGSGMPRNL